MAKGRAHPSKRPTHQLILAAVLSVSVLLPLLVPAAATVAVAVAVAEGGGKQLAVGKDEGKLVSEGDAGGGGLVEENEFAGGFGSLDSMLQWAIGMEKPNP
jgi:hsp70-interacting protein